LKKKVEEETGVSKNSNNHKSEKDYKSISEEPLGSIVDEDSKKSLKVDYDQSTSIENSNLLGIDISEIKQINENDNYDGLFDDFDKIDSSQLPFDEGADDSIKRRRLTKNSSILTTREGIFLI